MARIRRRLGSLLGPEGRVPQIDAGQTRQTNPGEPAKVILTKTGDAQYRIDVDVPSGLNEDGTLAEPVMSEVRDVSNAARDAAIQDATQKYGGLPQRVTTTESTLTTHSQRLNTQDQTLQEHGDKLEPVESGDDQAFNIRDRTGLVAFGVTEHGTVMLGDTEVQASEPVHRVMDQSGAIAFEVDAQGRTHVYDPATGGSGVGEWHAFLCVGQSNMAGSGMPYSPELDPPDPRILQYGYSGRALEPATVPLDSLDNGTGMSPATGFAREYLTQLPDHVGVLLIPAAKSATTFTDEPSTYTWRPGAASESRYDLYGQSVQQAQEALAAIGDAGQLKGILWHQGEGNTGMTTTEYAADLDNLIDHYRTDLNDPDLPFVVGQLTQERLYTTAARRLIDRAHYETPARVERTGFAPSEWGWASYDETHFGRTGALKLGKNMVDAYWQALANTPDAQLLPPHTVTTKRVSDTVTIAWVAPPSRVTGYQIRTRPITGGSWTTITRDFPMQLHETLTTAEPVEIEIRAVRDTETSTPVITQA